MKKKLVQSIGTAFLLAGMLAFTACHSSYELTGVEGGRVKLTAAYDSFPDKTVIDILAPYKAKVDSIMSPVIGKSEMEMTAERPESLLSNFAADVLRHTAARYTDLPVDVGITNMGGLRNPLPEGDVTVGNVYEIFPFENSLCILKMDGKALTDLFVQIAKLGGEALSGARLTISKDKELKKAEVGGKPIVADRTYVVATIDYLAEGNDGLSAFLEATERVCPEGATLRQIIIDYIKEKAGQGKAVASALDGRITAE